MSDHPFDSVQSWLDRRRAGEKPSLNELCRLSQDRVKQLVRLQLPCHPVVDQESQATDVTNETLLRLLRALEQDVVLKTTLDLERFLAAKIRHVLLDMTKAIRRRRRRIEVRGDSLQAIPATPDEPFDVELMADFHEYVETLTEDAKTLFDLIYYQGKTLDATARLLGLSKTEVQRRWSEARSRTREKLGLDLAES